MPFKTEAFVVRSLGSPFKLEEIVLDDPDRNEVLVKIVACGICQTDVHAQHGVFPSEFPCTLGHEGAGLVVAIGEDVTRVKVGDQVLLSFSSCRVCKFCSRGEPAACARWAELNFGRKRSSGSTTNASALDDRRIHGNFFGQSSLAKHALVAEASVVPVSRSADLVALAPLGCGMQTGAGAILNVLKPEFPETSSVVVFGVGAVGLAAVFACRSLGIQCLIVVDVVPSRLELSLALGANHAYDGKSIDLINSIRRVTEGGADYVIEATGSLSCVESAWKTLGPRGKMVQLGSPGPGHDFAIPIHDAICTSKTYCCSNQGDSDPTSFIPDLVAMYERGHFPLDKISKTFSYLELEEALQSQKNGSVIKPIIVFE